MNIDNELKSALFFDLNDEGKDFRKYLDDKKILIDNKLFNRYLNIFIWINCTDRRADTYAHYADDNYSKYMMHMKTFIKIVQENGYAVSLIDVLEYPFLIRLVKINNIPEDQKSYAIHRLYTNIHNISHYESIVKLLGNDDLSVMFQLDSGEPNTKAKLTKLYNDHPGAVPNRAHLLIALKAVDHCIGPCRHIIDFFLEKGVKVYVRYLSYSCTDWRGPAYNKMARIRKYAISKGMIIKDKPEMMKKKPTIKKTYMVQKMNGKSGLEEVDFPGESDSDQSDSLSYSDSESY